jgi:hypothetical protein
MTDIPKELLEQRPVLEGDPTVRHPEMGNMEIGPPPRKYTQAVHERICDELRKGHRAQGACARAGITTATFYNWIRMGKEGNPHLAQFVEDVEIAYNEAEANALDVVNEVMDDKSTEANPKLRLEAAQWKLERTRADGYSKQVKTLVDKQIEQFVGRLEAALVGRPAKMMTGDQIFELVLAVYLGHSPAGEIAANHVKALPEDVAQSEE